jgi:ABC-2 type transport system permease protein
MTAIASRQAVRAPARELHVVAAVIRRCLRDQRRSPLTWGLPLGLMSALEVGIYPSVEKSLSKAMSGYPQALKQAFRIEDMSTPAQYLNAEMFSLIIPLAVAFFAIRAATRPIVGAEERHWIDTVLAAPVRRRTLMAGAFIAGMISSAVILLVNAVLIVAAGHIFGAVIAVDDVLAGSAEVWALVFFFAGLAQLVAGRFGNWAGVTGIAAGMLVLMYIVDVAARIADALHDVGPFSVFHYYGKALTEGLNVGPSAAVAGIGVLLAAVGLALFERRDIHG